ncbi:hypothetical protein GCM10020000_75940 [Streptomyces olivoverticillatus]
MAAKLLLDTPGRKKAARVRVTSLGTATPLQPVAAGADDVSGQVDEGACHCALVGAFAAEEGDGAGGEGGGSGGTGGEVGGGRR